MTWLLFSAESATVDWLKPRRLALSIACKPRPTFGIGESLLKMVAKRSPRLSGVKSIGSDCAKPSGALISFKRDESHRSLDDIIIGDGGTFCAGCEYET